MISSKKREDLSPKITAALKKAIEKVVAETKSGRTISREYRKADEEAAYATGAAALVPFAALRRFVLDGQTAAQIAKHYHVSRELVEYRLQVTRLWQTYRAAHSDL